MLPVPDPDAPALIPVIAARFQLYVVPATDEAGEKLNLVLLQMAAGLGLGFVKTGCSFMVTVTVRVFTQPLALLPETV
jgi:hypothetical protein